MSRDPAAYVADMLDACERICTYAAGFSATALKADQKTIDAIVRNLEVLGEAAKQVPSETRAAAPDIPWRSITGFRDVLIHAYFGLDVDVVCDVALVKVPPLREELVRLLALIDARG